jgi:hypothetical protein
VTSRNQLASSYKNIKMSQPMPHVIVSHLIVLIVRTPLLTAPSRVCVLPPSAAIVTTPVPDPLLSIQNYCFLPLIVLPDSYVLLLFSCPLLFCDSLLFLRSYCLSPLIVFSGLLPSTGQLLKPFVHLMYSLSRVSCQSQ